MVLSGPRVEQRDAGGRGAVILVREHDDGEVRVRSEEPLVLRRRSPPVCAERAQERRELTLEATPGLAQRRDALEHVRGVAGVIADAGDVRDVRGAGIEVGGRARTARRVLEDPLLAPCRIAAGDRSVARAHVLRDHGQVQVGQTLRALQPGHERRKIAQELVLRHLHRRRIVDEEQDVDVPVYGPSVCLGKNDAGPVGRRLALRSPHATPVMTAIARTHRNKAMRASYTSAICLAAPSLVAPSMRTGVMPVAPGRRIRDRCSDQRHSGRTGCIGSSPTGLGRRPDRA